ncbi:amidohydrolase family protein [Microbacterium sp. 18062]|uniref:amidohydrolase family protein n=1 Tax=Microbacterium sp. 18062 TaxID=2681410 RepID=UPI00135B8865|nr:amidohydrolase family protein [Microbacterium sp. 18062]
MYRRPAPDLLISRGHVLDVATGEHIRRDVGVRDGRVVPAAALRDPRIVDASERTVLFGLWDCHAHPGSLMHDPTGDGYFEGTPARTLRALANMSDALQAGVVGMRILGETDEIDIAIARATASGHLIGPRVLPSGLALHTTGGHGHAYPRDYLRMMYFDKVDGPDAIRRSIRSHVEHGAQWIKVCLTGGLFSEHEAVDDAQLDAEELEVLMRTAAARNIPVAAHCGSPRVAERFAQLGGRSIEHGYALDEAAAASMAANGTWLVPTISVSHDEEMMRADGWPAHAIARAKDAARAHGEALRACVAAGVRIAIGADLNPISVRLHRELELLEAAGMSRLAVLHAATAGGRMLNGVGSSTAPTEGDSADLIVVDGNPLDRMAVLREPSAVIVHGRIATAGIA